MSDQIKACCPKCQTTHLLTAVPIRGSGKIVWNCPNCDGFSSAEELEHATAMITHRKIEVPRHIKTAKTA